MLPLFLRSATLQVKRMAATKDMSVVSREYETSITSAWKNLVAGDIARMVRLENFSICRISEGTYNTSR